jgi:5-oxoprolinase (ATP-hydrolysing) subunit C
MGGKFEADDEHSGVVYGAECTVTVNDEEWPPLSVFRLVAGDILSVGPAMRGVRTYLCLAGGFVAGSVLGSVAGTVVAKGDLLHTGVRANSSGVHRNAPDLPFPESLGRGTLRVVAPTHIAGSVADGITDRRYVASNYSNRTGIRLDGEPMPTLPDRLSEPMCVGAIQLTNDGRLVVIGPDGPTIGGYPKVAYVAEVDHSRLGQILPGDDVALEWISMENARKLRLAESRRLERFLHDLT